MNSRYSDPSYFRPLPELLSDEPGNYEILDSRELRGLPTNGMVDQVNRVMIVPLEPAGRVVSRHECGHVAWSPTRPPRTRGFRGFMHAVEDGRINRGLAYVELPVDLEPEELAQVVTLGADDLSDPERGPLHWALRTVASYGTNAAAPLLALVEESTEPLLPFDQALLPSLLERVYDLVIRTHERIERARERAGGPVAEPKQVLRISAWLRRELLALGLTEPRNRGSVFCCLGVGPGGKATGSSLMRTLSAAGGPSAGRMRVARPALPHACTPPLRGSARRKRRAASEGALIGDLARAASDQRVFRGHSRGRRNGASVLIDTSGSMRLDPSDIAQIIAGAPDATLIAIYSGEDDEGELRVVVRDGRRIGVEGLKPYGPANVIDQPALEWLSKQPAPRIWISDGGVTGEHDRVSLKVQRRCNTVRRRADIHRVDDAAEAATVLQKLRRR